ncbi:helix-turn-helix domain-containing protein [Breznakiellaceae bacterium SP9]
MNTARKLLAANIKAKRTALGLTQEKLAELTDVSYQMVHDIEGCRTWVSDKTLQSLSKALGLEIYELFRPDEEADTETKELMTRFAKDISVAFNQSLDKVTEKYLA